MPISSILVGLALAILVVPFVAGPLIERRKDEGRRRKDEGRGEVEAAQQNALIALRDLDFDFRTGKIVEEDYTPLRQQLLVKAAEAAQAADVAEVAQPDWDAEIEAAVSAVRGKTRTRPDVVAGLVPAHCPQCHAPAREGDKFCHACGAGLDVLCPKCHQPVQVADKFCAHCGATLKVEVVPVS
ncbi:MAG: zinc ribbon domain-containing protein [Chloroflexi bacterium]|nr:zinc ribbon domain-containing protein [Chloroflexota bacterium]